LPPPYSAALLISIERTITRERLKRYLSATAHDLSRALELYEYNVQLSEALYGLLHGLEVAVRNAAHHALTISYGSASWYDSPPTPGFGIPQAGAAGPAWHQYAPLSPYWRDKVDEAKRRPGVGRNPGKVIAELTFGFWVDLLQSRNHRSLWVDRKLNAAFPNARGKTRSDIHNRLKSIQLLRNRISHHEPVLTTSNALYNGDGLITLGELMECVQWVCTETAQWMQAEFKYTEAQRILHDVAAMRITL